MSYKHSNAVREIPVEKFEGHTQRYILIELAHLADNAGTLRYSQQEIANAICLSRITVAKEMNLLESKGFISKEKHGCYKVNVLVASTQGRMKPSPSQEEESDMDDFEEWWDDNALSERGGGEAVPIPWDNIPEEVKLYVEDGRLEPREGMTLYHGEMCTVYERN